MTEVAAMQQQTSSGDTNDSPGRLVGVEDDEGLAWCFECADAEIRSAGETAFSIDLHAGSDARRKCVRCERRIGEVQG
jgi:hypothetical protein